ncbi:MAG: hypothetical protein HY927_02065 [Elusimicrobia bacterium]|nr:hypothetical protein [Elusimicrobiota bacterium]
MRGKISLLLGLMAAMALALGGVYLVLERFEEPAAPFPPAGEGRRIEVFEPAAAPEEGQASAAVRAAVVSVAPSGALGLQVEREGSASATLESALRAVRRAGGLPLMVEAAGRIDGQDGRKAGVVLAQPQDPRYAWAVLDRLRREGLDCSLAPAP